MLAALLHALLALASAVDAHAGRAAPAPLHIESAFDPPHAYVGAEVILSLRILRAPSLPQGVLRPPHFGDDAEVTSIGHVRYYQETRLGAAYEVREQNYLVVPRRAGRLLLPGPEVLGPLGKAKAYARALRGAPRALIVLPPRTTQGEPWLPARHLALEESWSHDPAALTAGQPVVRTLVVRAAGISGNRLPSLPITGQARLSVHEDTGWFSSEYLDDGMAGLRAQRFILIAQDEGEIELPALSLAWWDTGANLPAVATLPARTLRIGAAVAGSAPQPEGMSPLDVVRWFVAAVFVLGGASWWAYEQRRQEREAAKRLRHACRRGAASAAQEALVEWWKGATGGATAPVFTRMGAGWGAPARAALAALDAAVYGRHAWDGDAFWRAVRPWLRRRSVARRAPARPAGSLPPLFKLQAPVALGASSSAPLAMVTLSGILPSDARAPRG